MNVFFRVTASMAAAVRADLRRRHFFAAERVGFLLCRAAAMPDGGLLLLAGDYLPVADDDYVRDRTVGAMMGPGAIRKALERAYDGGAQDISLFHVHEHSHPGRPGYSQTDWREMHRFVPDFFNAAPAVPHGAVVLSHDMAVGMCWVGKELPPVVIKQFGEIGAPLKRWRGEYE